MYYLYQTQNTVNGKIYIGIHQSSDIENDSYLGSGKHLERAINKYGINKFQRRILQEFEDKEQAYKRQQEIVDEEFINREDTYNMKVGGIGGFSDKLYWLGKHHSEETKQKCSLINKGKTFSQETRKKLSQAKKGKPTWNKGISCSDQTKQKISIGRRGKCVGENNPFYGKTFSQQVLTKLKKPKSKQHIEKVKKARSKSYTNHSNQTKQKISKSLREYYSKQKTVETV